jgi:hypothetical protein
MGLFPIFEEAPRSPGMGDRADDGLCTRVNMHMLDNHALLAAST